MKTKRLLATLCCLAYPAFAAEEPLTGADVHPKEGSTKLLQKKPYSPHVNQSFPNQVFFGDLHHHTSFSFDSGLIGNSLAPEQAYRFARGEQLVSAGGQPVKLARPLDFLAITDHAEYLGLADLLATSDPELLANEYGRKWHGQMKTSPEEGGKAAWEVGNTVDVANASYKNTVGDSLLMVYWKDPEFDASQRAFYYVRVVEIPSPSWTAYDAKRLGSRWRPKFR